MWFAVSLFFESCHPGQPSASNLWEESIILVDAASYDEAEHKAERLGKADECDYTSVTGQLVQWRFRGIEHVYLIETNVPENGAEIFSRFLSADKAMSLLAPFREASSRENPGNG